MGEYFCPFLSDVRLVDSGTGRLRRHCWSDTGHGI